MENKFTGIKERVLQIVEKKGVSKESFFTKIGMSSANFRGKAKETPLNSNAIREIISIYPEINLHWLITGEGETEIPKPSELNPQFISKHDLHVLGRKYYESDLEDVKRYLLYSEAYIKAKCSDLLLQTKENIDVLNKISNIAHLLKIHLDEYYSNRFDPIDEELYIKGVHEDMGIDSVNFENQKIKWIVKLLAFERSLEHISYSITHYISYLERGCKMYLDYGSIKLDEELIEKTKD